ncbi:putative RNA polymerase II CTD phosphatase Fcp1, partial [Corchorus olitorius]
GSWIDRQGYPLPVRIEIRGRAIEHVHRQLDAAGLDPVADDIAEQAVAAHLAVEGTVQAQGDGFRADRQAAAHRALQQAAGAVGIEQVVVADEAGGKQ